MRRSTLTAVGLLGAGAAAVATVASFRRWSAAGGDEDRLSDLPGTEGAVSTPDGTSIGYTDSLTGSPAVVMVHGWTEDRRVWGPVARRLAEAGARVVAYDQRGHGRSSVGSDGCAIDAIADDLRAVLEDLDLHDAIVVGHSMGGMAAQAFAARHPDVLVERVAGLCLVATASAEVGLRGVREKQASALMAHAAFQRAISHPTVGPLLTRGAVGQKPVFGHLQATASMLAGTSVATRTGFLAAMGGMDLSGGLADIKVPTTVIVGTHDRLTPEAAGRRISSLVPGARLEVVPGAGHMLPLERPDLVARLILDTPSTGG